MSERYSKLFPLPENLYAESAPVIIAAGTLLKDNQTGKVLAQIKFKNISFKTIKAIKISIRAYDVSGAELQGVSEYQYLDLSAARDEEFGQKNAITLPDDVTRSFAVKCGSVVFIDGTTWENEGAEWKPLAKPETLTSKLGNLAPQYQRDTVARAQFVIADERDLWLCACGAINGQIEAKCHACGSKKEALITALDIEKLKQHKAVFDKEEAEKNAKNAEEQKKKKAKTKKTGIIGGAVTVVVIAVILVITQIIVPSSNYNSAIALMNDGKYEEAINAFKAMGDYNDAPAKIEECKTLSAEAKQEQAYQDALTMLNGGKYEEAISAFESLEDYKDSAEQITETKYQQAISLLDSDVRASYGLFYELGDYKDSVEHLAKFKSLLIEETHNSYVTTYEYDENSRLIRYYITRTANSKWYLSTDETTYTYNDSGLILSSVRTQISDGNTAITTTNYDEHGNPVEEYTDNANESHLDSHTTWDYTYYPSGNIKTCKYVCSALNSETQQYEVIMAGNYSYEENGDFVVDWEKNTNKK
jgi:hypothetical protein